MAVRSADEAWRSARVDLAKVEATTEAEIERFMIAEGENPDAPLEGYRAEDPAGLQASVELQKRGRKASARPAKRSA